MTDTDRSPVPAAEAPGPGDGGMGVNRPLSQPERGEAVSLAPIW